MTSKLTTSQAAARLGVTPQTLYAYVSRGIIDRTLADDGRSSRFDAAEVEALAKRSRPRRSDKKPGRVQVSMASAITHIDGHTLRYRGHDVLRLCEQARFEQVAMLLWTGILPERASFALPAGPPRAALAVARALPPRSPAIERFVAVCAALACAEPLRLDLRPEAVAEHGAGLIATLVEALPPVPSRVRSGRRGARPQSGASVAARLWSRLSPRPPTRARVGALDRALSLLADHELATSTLAARVAASTRADPFAVVIAGLATASGHLHGKAASGVHRLLLEAEREPGPPEVLLLRTVQERGASALAGFGHPVYSDGDPRASALLDCLSALPNSRRLGHVERVRAAARQQLGAPENVDFALGALAYLSDMPVGATDAIFVLARVAGWIAHGLEEYREVPLRFRARATYEGIGAAAVAPAADRVG